MYLAAIVLVATQFIAANELDVFKPKGEVALSGSHEFDYIHLPSGVPLWVKEDLVLMSRTDIVIDGGILGLSNDEEGDGVSVKLLARGRVFINGDIRMPDGLSAPSIAGADFVTVKMRECNFCSVNRSSSLPCPLSSKREKRSHHHRGAKLRTPRGDSLWRRGCGGGVDSPWKRVEYL